MAVPVNVACCEYDNGAVVNNWATSGTSFYAGYNQPYSINRVLIVRFTLEKPAKTVEIPLNCWSATSSYASNPLCYGLGGDPSTDTAMNNKNGTDGALGTFYFSGSYTTETITLSNLPEGTHYLYIWGNSTATTTQTAFNIATTCSGITYEEQEGLVYFDNGTGHEPYQCYIDNGTGWDLCIPYVDNGTGWDICG